MNALACSKCGKLCKDKRGLSVHEARCQITHKLRCTYCSSFFDSDHLLKTHLEQCKAIQEAQERLKQSFTYQSNLEHKDKIIQELQQQIHTLELEFHSQNKQDYTNQLELLQSFRLQSIQDHQFLLEEKDKIIAILQKTILKEQENIKTLQDTINQLNEINDDLRSQQKKDKDIIYDLAFKLLKR